MSEDKLKRELARFGLKNARSTNNTSLYSQLPFQPHSPRKPNYERGWNNTKQPRTSYHNYHQATVKYEPPREVPHLLIDRKEFHQDFQQYDLKTLLDSRLADKKENETPKKTYGLIMDWEEFHREVKQFGLKTLKDSRWA
ncbi:hypothetical protein GGR51DRAFT_524617 [Nemania sp. FL0031]|nr:hypothetical protein GGR51DRAFT_524617 [Nemania sp. FL0031]